ncbi:hypothetical protein BGZ61DRAFT_557992 [Ilyonectria robusta]|uniref:uncharacterized protein n=1 Tax=Ilyonectria robusta TaxID=1079257 RepID=UPI001E8D05E4|nr:uncharacterized protein BGZ61DRAFT_557992 [Ilyonectria robusta]KAH8669429.1 hypothetical protein BGZ61DRAFT_557992 [Ilyonectria robusta]
MLKVNSKLPQDPYLLDFIRLSRNLPPDHIIVIDHETGVQATITDLITAVCEYRVRLGNELGTETLTAIRAGKEVFIATILPPGYDFVVAFLAILSLGAGLVPLSTKLLPEEVAYYISQSGSHFILCDQNRFKLASAVPALVSTSGSNVEHTGKLQVICLGTSHSPFTKSPYPEIEFDQAWTPSLEAPSLILFTSGSSGPPKGAMFPRRYLHNLSHLAVDALQVTARDIFLHSRGVHWVSGVRWSLGMMLAGARVEFCESRMSPTWWCKRVAEGGVTMCYEMPRIWMSIMLAIEKLPSLPFKDHIGVGDVKRGLESARLFMSGGTPAIGKVMEYWNQSLPRGLYTNLWGITELGGMITYHDAETNSSDPCVGRLLPNVTVKFDESGQACVKSPLMFLGYVSDPERTQLALNEEGFFKTGDAVEIRQSQVYLSGRIGLDYIRFKGLKMYAADIEDKINELPYVHESAVMPVTDQEFGQRVAAVIQVKSQHELPSLKQLRYDLQPSLPQYKMPTIITLVDGPLLRTTTGKLAKTAIRKNYVETETSPAVHKERWYISYESGPRRNFMWDWAGMH